MASRSSASNNSNMRLYIILGILTFAIIVGVLVGSQYREKFTDNNSINLLYFYNENCGHCANFDKTWQSLSNNPNYKDVISFSKYDVAEIDKNSEKTYGELYNIPYYPYIMLIKTVNKKDTFVFDSNIERSQKNIIKWVNDKTKLSLPLE